MSKFILQHVATNASANDNNIVSAKKTICYLFDYSISFPINEGKLTICHNLITSVILLQLKEEQQIIDCFGKLMNQ